MARRGTRRGETRVGTARRSRRTGRPHGECAVMRSSWSAAHRHGLVQLSVLVVCLDLSGQLLGARSTAQGSVRLGVSEGGGSDADHRGGARGARTYVDDGALSQRKSGAAESGCTLQRNRITCFAPWPLQAWPLRGPPGCSVQPGVKTWNTGRFQVVFTACWVCGELVWRWGLPGFQDVLCF